MKSGVCYYVAVNAVDADASLNFNEHVYITFSYYPPVKGTRYGSHEFGLEGFLPFSRPFVTTYQQFVSMHEYATSKKPVGKFVKR